MPQNPYQIHARYDRRNIDVTMEPWQDTDLVMYGLECRQCVHNCDFHFLSRKGLSFAFVGKLVGAFSSPCRVLAEEEARRYGVAPAGQLSLISNAGGDEE